MQLTHLPSAAVLAAVSLTGAVRAGGGCDAYPSVATKLSSTLLVSAAASICGK